MISARTVSLCGRNSVQVLPSRPHDLDLDELATRLASVGEVDRNAFALTLRVEPYEITVFRDGRGLVKGTDDGGEARSAFARYTGI